MTALANESKRVLVVQIGDARRALLLSRLEGVTAPGQILRLPQPPPGVCGAAPFRNRVVPVVDAGLLVGGGAADASGPLVFLRRLGEVIALRVDAILGVHGLLDEERLDPDTLPMPEAPPRPRRPAATTHGAGGREALQLSGLLFHISGRPFWLGHDQALEVLQQAEPITTPWANPQLPALLLHKGEAIAVVRLDLLLGTGAVPAGPWVICQAGPERLAFRIDDAPTLAERGDAQFLDLHALLPCRSGGGAPTQPPPMPTGRAYIAFQLERQLCLLPLAQVRSVSEQGRVITLPGASASLQGARSLRGRVLPVLDPRPLLGLDASAPSPIHLEVAAPEAPAFVLTVQGVDSVVRVLTDTIAAGMGGAVQGVVDVHGRLAWLLDGAGLLRVARAAP